MNDENKKRKAVMAGIPKVEEPAVKRAVKEEKHTEDSKKRKAQEQSSSLPPSKRFAEEKQAPKNQASGEVLSCFIECHQSLGRE